MKEYEKLELEKWKRLARVCIVRRDLSCRLTYSECSIDKCVFYQWSKNNGIQNSISS